MSARLPGQLIIISGPSGSGKSTVVRSLLQESELPLELSVSATTRRPRPGEVDGQHYIFLDDQEFHRRREDGEFLEFKEVFGHGHWYGTLRQPVMDGLQKGKWIILEIDVQGAMAVLEHGDLSPVTIFIHPGSVEELELRLRKRGTESEDDITRRLQTAIGEMNYIPRYQYEIINGTVPAAVAEISRILNAKKESHPCSKS